MGNWNWISVVTGHLEGIDVQGKYDFQHSVYITDKKKNIVFTLVRYGSLAFSQKIKAWLTLGNYLTLIH